MDQTEHQNIMEQLEVISQIANTINQNAVAQISQPQSTPKKQNEKKNKNKSNYFNKCKICQIEGHFTGKCPQYITPQQKRTALANRKSCQECAKYIPPGTACWCSHLPYQCRCGGWHWEWLCLKAAQPQK